MIRSFAFAALFCVLPTLVAAPAQARALVQPATFSIARDFTLSFDHPLGVKEARRRVDLRFRKLQQKFGGQVASSTLRWDGDIAHVAVSALGQTANAEAIVTATNVRLHVHLPLLLAPLSGQIQDVLTETAYASLRED